MVVAGPIEQARQRLGVLLLLSLLQCSGYTCGAGFTADTSKQSTACPSGTCTDGFCCQPAVRLMIRQLSHAWCIECLLLARLNKPGRDGGHARLCCCHADPCQATCTTIPAACACAGALLVLHLRRKLPSRCNQNQHQLLGSRLRRCNLLPAHCE